MKNGNRKYSIMTNDFSKCFICGSPYVEKHEIYYGAFRTKSIEYGCIVPLCPYCHKGGYKYGTYIKGVHDNSGKGIDLELKKECQKKFESIHGHEKFMEVFKKNYI